MTDDPLADHNIPDHDTEQYQVWAIHDQDGTDIRATVMRGRQQPYVRVLGERWVMSHQGEHRGKAVRVNAEILVSITAINAAVTDLRGALAAKVCNLLDHEERRLMPSLQCYDLQDRYGFQCCSSCHHEWEGGYGSPSQGRLPDGRAVEACCVAREALAERGAWQNYGPGEW